ncbi:hypothetical protein GCM10023264_25150 [Sphingomonas daechungensis]|uniref:hypothetical protein n=1 Tax=Sphingomonas daechungensis TaxID=1176646 RepID=UPI0031E8638E
MLHSCIALVVFAAAQAAAPASNGVQWAPLTPNQPAAAPAAQVTPAVRRSLPAGTQVSVTPLQEISSKHVKEGERFQFRVVNDVVENGVVVIPRGSMATGVISMQTGRAIGGKSGKFDVTFEKVEANGRVFPLMGTHRQEGKGNTVGALLGSILISGRSAVMMPGQIVTAMVKEQTDY